MVIDNILQYRGATTPKLQNAPSIPFVPLFDVCQPFAGGSGPVYLGPAPLRQKLRQKGPSQIIPSIAWTFALWLPLFHLLQPRARSWYKYKHVGIYSVDKGMYVCQHARRALVTVATALRPFRYTASLQRNHGQNPLRLNQTRPGNAARWIRGRSDSLSQRANMLGWQSLQ